MVLEDLNEMAEVERKRRRQELKRAYQKKVKVSWSGVRYGATWSGSNHMRPRPACCAAQTEVRNVVNALP